MAKIWPKMMKHDQQIVKNGPKSKNVDFSEGLLAAEGGEQAILKMVVTMGDRYAAIYGVYVWPYMG